MVGKLAAEELQASLDPLQQSGFKPGPEPSGSTGQLVKDPVQKRSFWKPRKRECPVQNPSALRRQPALPSLIMEQERHLKCKRASRHSRGKSGFHLSPPSWLSPPARSICLCGLRQQCAWQPPPPPPDSPSPASNRLQAKSESDHRAPFPGGLAGGSHERTWLDRSLLPESESTSSARQAGAQVDCHPRREVQGCQPFLNTRRWQRGKPSFHQAFLGAYSVNTCQAGRESVRARRAATAAPLPSESGPRCQEASGGVSGQVPQPCPRGHTPASVCPGSCHPVPPRGTRRRKRSGAGSWPQGPQPERQAGTRAVFLLELGEPEARGAWSAGYVSNGPRSTDVAVLAPAGAPIGRYQLKIHLDSGYGQAASYLLGEFVLLFNAWCPEDEVYLASEPERQEYVMSEDGILYQGNQDWIQPSPWNYGQFEEDLVDICLELLDRSLNYRGNPARDCSLRGSAVYVSRVLSAMVNSNDDNGVLLGNWSEDYSGGVRPTQWSGSVAILQRWHRAGGQPVRYGQCWVFAAVMCTVMRCLGIPARVVTNFNSGHDTDGNLIIDVFYDKTGQLLPRESKDSVWNFHVWNECWMARRDLPVGYGGWQVLDATPQERSDGLYRCGPAPVAAIREGDVQHRYDAPFVFSMVNADRVAWLLSGGRREKLHWDKSSIGIHISTKRVGSQDREDITGTYKHAEGRGSDLRAPSQLCHTSSMGTPPAEALKARRGAEAVPAATDSEARFSATAAGSSLVPPPEAPLSLQLRLVESAEIGQDIHLMLLAQNLELAPKEMKLSLSAQPVLHDGTPRPPFWQDTHYLSLRPKEEKRISWRIAYGQYGQHLWEDRQVEVIAIAEENASWQKTLAEKTITLANPSLTISVLAPVVESHPFPLHVEFVNPLPRPVGGCGLLVEGGGLVKGQASIELGSLQAQEKGGIKFQLTPYKSGLRQLHVTLTSSQFPPIKGWKRLEVAPRPGGS
ncbi:PREDICTED: protein-glutamine gamma-glutamyltransferase 5-like [Gekko japonicus]|uniref:Protein-glutamine gamma-glutamyltransferase 5-like n=1 Tax=Gekko japonicus TaxID=146911 RepID=A0ABM1JR22_GEKJA|nr:PREDICTED: protein-glutamine gamma-glutamyltransferase 5-like [Gekko japonicus]